MIFFFSSLFPSWLFMMGHEKYTYLQNKLIKLLTFCCCFWGFWILINSKVGWHPGEIPQNIWEEALGRQAWGIFGLWGFLPSLAIAPNLLYILFLLFCFLPLSKGKNEIVIFFAKNMLRNMKYEFSV